MKLISVELLDQKGEAKLYKIKYRHWFFVREVEVVVPRIGVRFTILNARPDGSERNIWDGYTYMEIYNRKLHDQFLKAIGYENIKPWGTIKG